MKILQINASYKPAYIYGGPTMSVSMLAEQLAVSGAHVDVLTTAANGHRELAVEIDKAMILDGVKVTYFSRLTKDHTHFSPSLLLHLWRNVKEYDIIHIHAWWNLVSILSCWIAIIKRANVVVSPRGTLSNYSFSNKNKLIKGLIHHLLTKPLLKRCYVHTTSERERLAVAAAIKSKGFFNIPNFIRLNDEIYVETRQSQYLKIIFFSRIEEKKGLDMLLNALPKLKVPYRLSIAGDGKPEYINELKKIAIKHNVASNVEWLGFQGSNKFDLLQQHDLMILPSYDENFGNVVIESLSVGTAVLITENVGLADYVKENTLGWVCQTSPASIADTINAISLQMGKIKQIKIDAPLKIKEDFSNENILAKYLKMYHKILAHD